MTKAKVYFTKEITPQSLIAIYKALGVDFDKIYYESQTYLLGKSLVE